MFCLLKRVMFGVNDKDIHMNLSLFDNRCHALNEECIVYYELRWYHGIISSLCVSSFYFGGILCYQ